jgi:acetyl-CoA carboxylase carboxyltransferase component
MVWEPEVDQLRDRQRRAAGMGGAERVKRQHDAGRLTVRERIDELLDAGTFREAGSIAGRAEYDAGGELAGFTPANFVCGTGRLEGRTVVVGGDDFTVRGGAADASIHEKQVWAERAASQLRVPLIRLVDGTGGGGSVKSYESMGSTYMPVSPGWDLIMDNLSVVPVVATCSGPVAGLGAARVAAAHYSVMVAGLGQLFVAGPPVVKYATGEDLTKEQLGGAEVHRSSGAVDAIADTEREAFDLVRRFLSYLPSSVSEIPPVSDCDDPPDRRDDALISVVPRNRRTPYRINDILSAVFDAGSVLRYAGYGGGTVTALARLAGHPVAVVAADPYRDGGGLTAKGADALVRLVDLAETFHLPLVTLTDQPGLAVGLEAERRAVIRHGVRALAAVYQARVPAAEIVVRRVFGVAGAAMTNRHAFVRRWAWPSADTGSLPLEGGIEAAYRRDLEQSDDPDALREQIRARLDAVRSPLRTAGKFGIEEIIDPRDTRPLLTEWVTDAYRALPALLGRPSFGTRP